MTSPVMKRIMKPRHKWATAIHFVMNFAFYGYFLTWFAMAFAQANLSQIIWMSVFSVFIATDMIFHLWQITIQHKIAVVDTSVEVTGLRVAMIVTKAPSEPWDVVKNTLEHMMNQDGNFSYDVWLADENPSEDTKTWCAEQGVRISCRKDVDGYNNVDWPRRRKCKEGNLMYFYDKWGYDQYDVVFQFDSDHAPTKSYLQNSLPAFMDPKVSYVAMPNINNPGSWISNARQTQEAWYYGPSQMSYSYDHMPMMTGSHYAVRTADLKEIGGIGPELDEDMNTTLMFAARGKTGVYAGNAIALGEGPQSFEDAQKQEFQWAKSAIISFIRWKHVLLPKDNKMPFGGVFRFVMIRTWYTLQLSFFLYMWVLIGPLVFANQWCSADTCLLSFTSLVIHSSPILFANWGYEVLARKNDWLKPKGTPFFSVDLVVYRTLRPVWNLIGIFAGLIEMIFNVVPAFSVTRKGESSTLPLGVFTMWYFLLIPFYYAGFVAIKCVNGNSIPVMLIGMYAAITFVYTYIVFRHFYDQKFKALSWWNPIGHVLVLTMLIGALVALCVMFPERIFSAANAQVFIPHFQHTYQMWAVIGVNVASALWMLVLFVV
jgi:cellulose synthase (UDP-forming)